MSGAATRILGHYKRLVLLGKVRLPHAVARQLVGPDCAYHLYSRDAPTRPSRKRRLRQGSRRARRSR